MGFPSLAGGKGTSLRVKPWVLSATLPFPRCVIMFLLSPHPLACIMGMTDERVQHSAGVWHSCPLVLGASQNDGVRTLSPTSSSRQCYVGREGCTGVKLNVGSWTPSGTSIKVAHLGMLRAAEPCCLCCNQKGLDYRPCHH